MALKLYKFVSENFKKRFISESDAAEQAKQLGLTYAGWGKWKDSTGKVVAKTVDGQLVKVEPGEEVPDHDGWDSNLGHVNPEFNDLPDKFAYEPGKGLYNRETGQDASDDPEAQQYLDRVKGKDVDYRKGKGFYQKPKPPTLRDRASAFEGVVQKAGGAEQAIQLLARLSNEAKKSGDKNEMWKASEVAKAFKEVLPSLADRAIAQLSKKAGDWSTEEVPDVWSKDGGLYKLINYEEELDKHFSDPRYSVQTRSQTYYSPAEYDYYDWGENMDYSWFAGIHDIAKKAEQLLDEFQSAREQGIDLSYDNEFSSRAEEIDMEADDFIEELIAELEPYDY